MSPEVVREQPMVKSESEVTRQKERWGCLVCLRNNGEARAAGMGGGGMENEAEDEVSKAA